MKKQLAIVIAAVTVVLMGGAAFAVTGSPFTAPATQSTPTLTSDTDSSSTGDATDTDSSDTESSDTESSDTESSDTESSDTESSSDDSSSSSDDSSEAPVHPDNHGADVSSAAQSCPTDDGHGECVSAVARDNAGQSSDHGQPEGSTDSDDDASEGS